MSPTQTGNRFSTRTNHWQPIASESGDGIVTFRLRSWSDFFEFIETRILQTTATSQHVYVWRGHRRDDWSLSTSLDRLLDRLGLLSLSTKELEERSDGHLEAFRYAARGRRGQNPAKLSANDWWALGQHYGLATPLLDWSRSPFAAAYFAFETLVRDSTEYRVVFGLDQRAIELRNLDLEEGPSFEKGRLPIIQFFDPLSDENPRLVSQGGLFTRAPIGMPIDKWVVDAFSGSQAAVLVRIEIPNSDRNICLRSLNHMNINHASLFPDLHGSSRFTNLKLELGF